MQVMGMNTSKVNVDKLVTDAVATFEKAEAKVESAIQSIQSEQERIVAEQEKLDEQLVSCQGAVDRLSRIKKRIGEFMS